jgi:hypothetical protein
MRIPGKFEGHSSIARINQRAARCRRHCHFHEYHTYVWMSILLLQETIAIRVPSPYWTQAPPGSFRPRRLRNTQMHEKCLDFPLGWSGYPELPGRAGRVPRRPAGQGGNHVDLVVMLQELPGIGRMAVDDQEDGLVGAGDGYRAAAAAGGAAGAPPASVAAGWCASGR